MTSKSPRPENPAKTNLKPVLATLDYVLEVFRDNCDCGRCHPCTTGRMRIGKAKAAIIKRMEEDAAESNA